MLKFIFVVAASLLLASCTNSKNTDNKKENNTKTQNEETQMKRIKTDSGLEYEIIKEGAIICPKVGQLVTVHYTGWLDNNGELGKKFDSSVDRNQPFSFKIGIGQVIAGWDEGVMTMQIGEKRRLFIPADLGYGHYGAGNVIPPNAKLIFDVELIKVS